MNFSYILLYATDECFLELRFARFQICYATVLSLKLVNIGETQTSISMQNLIKFLSGEESYFMIIYYFESNFS